MGDSLAVISQPEHVVAVMADHAVPLCLIIFCLSEASKGGTCEVGEIVYG